MSKSTWFIVIGQSSLLLGMFICFLFLPGIVHHNGGVSNFGVHKGLVVPYSLALLLAGLSTIAAAHYMDTTATARHVAVAFYILGTLFIATLLTTYFYRQSTFFQGLHLVTGSTLFAFELLLAAWLALKLSPNSINSILLALQAIGSLISLLSLIGTVRLLFFGQMLTALSFAVLLVRATSDITTHLGQ